MKLINIALHHILKEKNRTGIAASGLVKGKKDSMPAGLNSNIINGWLRGTIKTAKKEHWDYVIWLWHDLPDNPYIEPGREEFERFLLLYEASKGHFAKLFKSPEMPDGLTIPIARRFASGKTKKIRRAYFEYLLEGMKSQVNSIP